MKNFIIITVGLLLTNQAFTKTASTSKQSDHSKHSNESSQKLSLNQGKKWEIDQVMIENMSSIMKENKRLASIKNATKEEYNELSALIASSAENIVTKCKLEPKADEAFHIILADLYVVSEHLKDSKKPKHAIEKLDKTLASYIKYFNHPVTK